MFKFQSIPVVFSSLVCVSALCATTTYANPVLDHVSVGEVQVQETGSQLVVNQTSQKAAADWKSFNIAANETTHFQQPVGGTMLNRVDASQGVSQIYGHLTATGRIILVNSAGIHFGKSAYVNVGSLIASTASMSDVSFMSDRYVFSEGTNKGQIINQGQIIAANHGLIALLGNGVNNEGLVQATMGDVILASGQAFALKFEGSDLVSFAIQGDATKGISNTGKLSASHVGVMLQADDVSRVLDQTINMAGVTEVQSVAEDNGVILLDGGTQGTVHVSGQLKADSQDNGVLVLGNDIYLDDGSVIDVSHQGGGGEVFIGAGYSIGHDGEIVANSRAAIHMAKGATINANALGSDGDGGNIIILSQDRLDVKGLLTARGATNSGRGGVVATVAMSQYPLVSLNDATVDVSGVEVGGRWVKKISDF